jgi:hypothetical protein
LLFTSDGIPALLLGAHAFAVDLSFVLEGTCGGGRSSASVSVIPPESDATDSPQLSSETSVSVAASLDVEASDQAPADSTRSIAFGGDRSRPRGVGGADTLRFSIDGTLKSSKTSMKVFLMQNVIFGGDDFFMSVSCSLSDLESSAGVTTDMDINNGTACILIAAQMNNYLLLSK